MYELIILSLLMRWPMHGYLIVKVTNDQIGPWAKISSGTLSTMLGRLEQAGLIAASRQEHAARGDRRSRTFMITAQGRRRFHELMMDTTSNLGDYQKIFYFKMGYLDLVRPAERLLLMNHYVNYCQAIVLHTRSEMEALVHELAKHSSPAYLENLLRVMRHVEEQWQAECGWAKAMRDGVLEQLEIAPSAPRPQEDA